MKLAHVCLPLLAASLAASASAQVSPDVIGQGITGHGGGPSDRCYDRPRTPSANDIVRAGARADKAFEEYIALAAQGRNLKPLFYGKQNWFFDGAVHDAVGATDPWADQVARVERTSLTLANTGSWLFRGVWNAYATDGSLLGTYDAMLQAGRGSAGFISLKLYSPGSTTPPEPVVPFCHRPGDVERWTLAKAQRAAEKAAERAERARN